MDLYGKTDLSNHSLFSSNNKNKYLLRGLPVVKNYGPNEHKNIINDANLIFSSLKNLPPTIS